MAPAPAHLTRHLYCCFQSPLRLADGTFRPRSLSCTAAIDPPHRPSRAPNTHKRERNTVKCWEDFYKRHHNKFFKDRHYLEKDWGRYFSQSSEDGETCCAPRVVLEVGCGAGNTLFPLLLSFPSVYVHACDFSPNAIALVKEHGAFRSDRVNAFICDVTKDDLQKAIMPASVDVVTMIFMLSAVSPMKMPFVLQNIKDVLKPGGCLLFRDYAVGDFAQEKLANKNRMISDNFYYRGDGTCAFYFSEDSVSALFKGNGFNPIEISVYAKQIVNHSRKVVMNRRWIRAAFCSTNRPNSRQPLLMNKLDDLTPS